MIIYLEGPDGSGKSTLSNLITNELIKHDKCVIQTKDGQCDVDTHPKSAHRNTAPQLIEAFVDMAYKDAIFVLDRGPISDVVYRMLDEHKPVINESQVIHMLGMLRDKVKVIFCNSVLAEQKMLERGDDNPIAIEKHKEITTYYCNIMDWIQHETFDYSKITASEFARTLVEDNYV